MICLKYLNSILKVLLINILLILLLSSFTTLLYYFNLLSSGVYNIFKLLIPLFSIFITTISFTKKVKEKGWFEGLKLGILLIIVFIAISCFASTSFSIKMMLYYLIILITAILGGMIGINKSE